jgi:Icc protein
VPRHPEEHEALVRLFNAGRSAVPRRPPVDGPPVAPQRLEVFGVGPDWVQLTWSALGPGPVEVRCGDHRSVVVTDGGPGAHLVDGLEPGRRQHIEVRAPGADPRVLAATTLPPPPGAELLRVATVSDVHVGSHSTGYLHTIVEIPEPEVPHAERCLRAAVDELTGWGARHLVVKGDLVDRSEQAHWDRVAAILDPVEIPVSVLPGNHERSKVGDVDPAVALDRLGVHLTTGAEHVDHDGVRIAMADTTRPGTDWGALEPVADDLVAAAAGAGGPVLVALHHQLMRSRVPTYLPPGIPGPQAASFLGRLVAANPRVLVTSGHTHRHRRHRMQGVTVTEVGSTKDFPGTWAGYHVHEGGIVQVVRRIAEPSCIRWTDHTRRAAVGIWGRWSPGPLASRCFSLTW